MQESRAEEISNKLSNLKKEEKNRAKKIQEVERTIQKLQEDMAKPVQFENMTEIDDEMVRLRIFAKVIFSKLWDSVSLIKATTARANARLTSKNNRGALLRTNRGLRPRWQKVNARMSTILCYGFIRPIYSWLD